MPELNLQTRCPLNDGHTIPQLGLGVFQLTEDAACEAAVKAALDCGYRHIDTAAVYRNEEAVGRAVADSEVPRDEVFITTKCWSTDFGRDSTRAACETSLRKLRADYVDLYLLHWPDDDTMMEAWETLAALREEGKCRSIGVSNFSIRRFEESFLPHTGVMPALNQVEIHPFYARRALRDYCAGKDILVQSYCPLSAARRLDDPVIAGVSSEVGKTPAQVLIRWHLQHGLVVIPKSQRPERIRENADVFDFALSDGQLTRLDGLDEDQSVTTWRPDNYY